MAFLGFGKKKAEPESAMPPPPLPEAVDPMGMPASPPAGPPPPSDPSQLPVEKIQELRSQGISNNQIVQTLQREGFPANQVFDAMNIADAPPIPGPQPAGPEMMPPAESPPMPPPPPPVPSGPIMSAPSGISPGGDREKLEELAEVIIDEKWEELLKSINKIIEWKEQTESTINKIQQQFNDLKSSFENLHQAIIGKIGEYDQNILSVGAELKAMEKVFQKVLPTLTENVGELSRITKAQKSKLSTTPSSLN